MKIVFLSVLHNPPPWYTAIRDEYLKKLGGFFPVEAMELRAQKKSRDQKQDKLKSESELLLKQIEPRDFLILLDEKGKELHSMEFSKNFERALALGKSRILICCGGAYGVTPELRERSDLRLSLSKLTFNHLLAQAIAYEQVYRALTIINNLPYHNE